MIRHDRYRPTQGHEYAKLGLVRPSGADVEFVFSRALYGEQELRMRPTAMPLEAMVVTGYSCPGLHFLAVPQSPLEFLPLVYDPRPRMPLLVARQDLLNLSIYR
jgi:hypothetical protein